MLEYHKHRCKCGCGGKIEIKKHHFWKSNFPDGPPLYINGHNQKNKPAHNKGKNHLEEIKQKISYSMMGKNKEPKSEEHKIKLSLVKKGLYGDLCNNW